MTEWSYGRARRRELEVWRNREMCHLHFTEHVAKGQVDRGDDCVVENPGIPVLEIELQCDVYKTCPTPTMLSLINAVSD